MTKTQRPSALIGHTHLPQTEDFDSLYVQGVPPWDIGRPQPAFAELAKHGLLAGRVLDAGSGTGEHALMAAALGLDSWTEEDHRIAGRRLAMTNWAGRWATEQVGRCGRTVSEVARELGCDWHTVYDAVMAFGQVLVEDPGRYSSVEALGLDEGLMVRRGPWRRQEFTTQIVDVGAAQLLDIVAGRSGAGPIAWLYAKGATWRDEVRYATLDVSGPFRRVFELMAPEAILVADPFHVVRLANVKLGDQSLPIARRD